MYEVIYDIATAMVLALLAYVSTNIDNLVLFSTLASGGRSMRPLMLGFAMGTVVILVVSISFSLLSLFVEPRYLSLLGAIPIFLGLRLLLSRQPGGSDTPAAEYTASGIALVLIANSIDTIVLFGPMFAESEFVVVIGLAVGFLACAAAWAVLVIRTSRHSAGAGPLARVGRRAVPFVMILIGIYILSDTWTDLQ